ncbi:beta-glucosidase [Pseudovibrio ascidiaceicola]|uniref:Beta-glucosidase n=1 Tax=Pseudovibrio ascidiaceicola TaxID=285279 RepID=A0A1I4FCF4_9HYPH|nr:GH1 family beta-glucosidase [Pseudovibrio ascidiaceicola]SFL14557.1 beta-glucosidase [Pseudovibrio ascidiaceicola]
MSANHTSKLQHLQQLANSIKFPRNMVLGAATASYQIEGAVNEGGRSPSVWDHFTRIPGNIADGTNGDIACDHYHRLEEDVALMKELGLTAYRFSICWSRILPNGRGPINEEGVAFYERLTDLLFKAGITPYATLYHWDLPLTLQEEGNGWLRRGLVDDYINYVDITTQRLGSKIKHWTTFNELFTFTWWGYGLKEDAPGFGGGAKAALAASHHALLAHGRAVPIIRRNVPDAQIGIVLDLNPVTPASDTIADLEAARRFEGCQNRWYLDAIFNGQYPADMLETYKTVLPYIEETDLHEIAQPLDYLGINIYRRSIIKDGTEFAPVNFERHLPEGKYTQMGWEVHPECLYDILQYVNTNYAPKQLFITENGAAFSDTLETDGSIQDCDRSTYVLSHLKQAARAIEDGIPLKGYFCWTLMDNFEWAEGYLPRFGLIHVDFETQERTIKQSGRLYSMVADQLQSEMREASE